MTAPAPRRAHRLAAGCVGGMAVAVAASWARFAVEGSLALDTSTPAHLVASGAAGLGLLTTGLCSLRLAAAARSLSWRALVGWALALQAVAALAIPLTSTDAYTSLAHGALERNGLSAYLHAPAELAGSPLLPLVPARWQGVPSAYGPLFLRVMRAVSGLGERLGGGAWGGLVAYKAVLLALSLCSLGLAARHLRRLQDGRGTFALIALGPLLAWELTAQAHNDAFVVLATVAFAVAAGAGRDALAAAVVALGLSVKIVIAPLLALHLVLVGRRSIPRAAWAGAVGLAVAAAAYAGRVQDFAGRGLAAALGSADPRHAHSFADLVCLVLDALGRQASAAAACRALSAASAAACLGALGWAALRARTLPQLGRGYLVVLLAYFLTATWFQPWYVSWALPVLILEPDPRWRRFLGEFAVVTVVQWGLPLDPVTTVAANGWALWRAWQLLRADSAPLPQAAMTTSADTAAFHGPDGFE